MRKEIRDGLMLLGGLVAGVFAVILLLGFYVSTYITHCSYCLMSPAPIIFIVVMGAGICFYAWSEEATP